MAELAEKGPPPPDDRTTKREVDARYAMDLDDGVMVNSAALWPVLEPQWKDPKKWWKELAEATGKKDYDWSHLAARYFPARVRSEVPRGPVARRRARVLLGAAPRKGVCVGAAAPGRDPCRLHHRRGRLGHGRWAFLKGHEPEAREIAAKEQKRREKKGAAAGEQEQTELAYEAGESEEGADE